MFAFNAGSQCYLRNDSVRKLRLSDLKLDFTHGPVESGPHARIITFVLQPLQHKEKENKKQVAGVYQHKDYLLCTTFDVAINVFWSLSLNYKVHFYKEGENKWMNSKLIVGWKDQKSAYATYKTILEWANVSWDKVTHMRKAGIEQGSAQGELRRDEVR